MQLGLSIAILLLSTTTWAGTAERVKMTAQDLKCEFRKEPLGIDTIQPRLSWTVSGTFGARDLHQRAYRILVASSPALLAHNTGDLWDSGKIASAEQNNVPYAGKSLASGLVCFWKVKVWDANGVAKWSRVSKWEMGLLHPKDWTGQWINDGKLSPKTDEDFYKEDPSPIFRKAFTVEKQIAKARLYIAGLGYYEPSLNGQKVGDHVLDPGWTKVDKRVLYNVFDVTRQLKSGANCLGVMLGNGWYNPLPLKLFGSFNLREHLTIGRPRLLAQLHIEYRDGSNQTISSDRTWKVAESSILRNNTYLGEFVDARKEQPGWNTPAFDDSKWRKPAVAKEKVGLLYAQSEPPIRVTSQWNSIQVTEPKPGTYIYDCGVNFAGWVQLKLNVPAGTQIHLRYGELLHADGTLNPMTSVAGQIKGTRQGTKESIGGPGAPPIAWQTDTYIARGGGEIYVPKFTFHGFRYVEITGLKSALPVTSVKAMRLNSDVQDAGSFACSNPMLNQVQEITRRTFLSNIFSVQSDCPHRERLGYGGDIVATSEAFMDNFDMSMFYGKVVRDWSDSALPGGMFTDTAPFMGIQYCGVIWAMAHPVLVDQLYRYYGNRQIGADEYDAAKRWLLLVEKQYPDGIVTDGLSDHEALVPNPSSELVTPMYFECAKLLSELATRLSKTSDADHFRRLASKIRGAYQSKFVDSVSGKVGPGTQACQAFALYTGIVPDSTRKAVLDYLINDIKIVHKGHLDTGILGTKFMLDVLSREGHADLAYEIATQPDFPGWGWMLKNGATTLWEHWAISDNTFSHNHPMFGSVSQWMMNWLGGIQLDQKSVGFDHVVIRPQTVRGLEWVHSSRQTIRGKIRSNWSRHGKTIRYEIEIPGNVQARILLDCGPSDSITEGGKAVSPVHHHDHLAKVSIGSGHYVFEVKSA